MKQFLSTAFCLLASGCSTKLLQVNANVPTPLVTPMPMSVGVRIPKEFAEHVQKEEIGEAKIEIAFGPTQAAALRRVTNGMFEKTEALDPGATAAGLQALLDASLDSYVYVLPSSNSAEFYSATIGYKIDISRADGTVLGSWIFEGYGSVPARGVSRNEGIAAATALAIRDACANIAVHLPQQDIVKNLLGALPP